eukprot:404496_1
MKMLFGVICWLNLIIVSVFGDALECYQSVYSDKAVQTVKNAQLGLGVSEQVFALGSSIPGPVGDYAGFGEKGVAVTGYVVDYYGDSITDDESIWGCLDTYLDDIVSEIYGQVASFASKSAKHVVDDLLKPVNNLAVNHISNDEAFYNNFCKIIKSYMNEQSM